LSALSHQPVDFMEGGDWDGSASLLCELGKTAHAANRHK
jgi:hypothetical protein